MTKIASVEKLRLKFPGGESLLFKDLSSSFHKGEKVLFLGPSGCGKSTLLQVLTGLIPNSIEVPMKAEEIQIPDSWGYVFQDPDTQFCMPFVDEEIAFVLENLQVPRSEMKERIHYHLQEVGLKLEDIHTNIQTLSGGMKQRLAIASVMALNPDVLFLDEPTAMLDPEGTEQIWETIKRVGEDKTLLIVEHKLEHVIDIIERIVLFNENGEIIADGDKETVLSEHKQALIEQGIWYPGVWEDYLKRTNKQLPSVESSSQEPLLIVEDFKGYRWKETKIEVPKAEVTAGEWIAVIGENGAGKSTLLHAFMQFIKTTGIYQLEGQPVEKIKKLTNYLTFVFQNPEFQFVTNSVYEEIAYALRLDKVTEQEIDQKVTKLLHTFNLTKQKEQHPYLLSMGQKRRLSVAAAIVKEQKIILLDEPTFGQDAKNTFAMLELIEHWRRQGTTIIMVTHSPEITEHFVTRIWTVEDGRLVSDQTPAKYGSQRTEVVLSAT
ncbi:ABC transporter ATP-binding protein [Bacillus taeanensis]|uniref:ABC transporter ATP-binding protein n=1 Tax=Bacillus taeanensis TaxID=273032 RepID=A0A366XY61_9BACI|nr:ABC transporter ATP-binding protein [Bacillus taeanensis]RBW69083.1 ABC transporter ATP-binding protein [Bacillus taeanensis]